MCVYVHAALPRAPATGGTVTNSSGAAILLQAYRFIVDSRDKNKKERLEQSFER